MPRLPIDIGLLDLRVQELIAKFGSLRDFHVTLWRQEPDATGSNWNGHIGRTAGLAEIPPRISEIVQLLRLEFNLS